MLTDSDTEEVRQREPNGELRVSTGSVTAKKQESESDAHGPMVSSFCQEQLNSPNLCSFEEEQAMEDVQLSDAGSPEKEVNPQRNEEIKVMQEVVQEERGENEDSSEENYLPVTITISKASDETPDDTFKRLKDGYLKKSLSQKEVVDGLFNLIVGGPFDLETRFIIEYPQNVEKMLEFIGICSQSMQAEIWSVFVAIVRKSFRNLEACCRVGLISKCLDLLPIANSVISDLLIQLLSALSSYSITVKETKALLRALQAKNGVWGRNSAKLLSVMQEMPKRDGADVFFSFPGKASAGIALPPLHRWPQNGWSFATWFRADPLNSVNFEKEKPYLFSFLTKQGLGYQCYFMGNCLVVHCIRGHGPNKETTRCVRFELTPRKWHHVVLSYVYSRWAKSEIQCYIDGQLVENIDATWLVSTSDYFDRCFVGCGSNADANEAFCGQMAAVYVFSQPLSAQQEACLYSLGPAYQSLFKFDAGSNLPEGYRKNLFNGQLNSSLVFAYCPKNVDGPKNSSERTGQLCLFPGSKNQTSYFVQVPHAIMKEGVEVITTHSIHSSLHSVGGIQMLLPLFAQIDMPHEDGSVNYEICEMLLSVIYLLLSTSLSAQQQLFHSQGLLIIAHVLNTSSEKHLSSDVLDKFIEIASFLQNSSAGIPLVKQLFDHIFFTPQLWIRTEPSVQMRLYNYLATDFVNANFSTSILRRTSTVAGLIHTLKFYYWIVRPNQTLSSDGAAHPVLQSDKPAMVGEVTRLDRSSIVHIRGYILQLINKLMFVPPPGCEEKDLNRDDEFQCLFNYIATVEEDDNLYDVVAQMMRQVCEHPAVMVPAFDRKQAIAVIFKLASSGNELIRIPALKTFGYFLCRSTLKRKNEAVNHLNLLHLLSEKLLINSRFLSLATYNVLFEILIEQMCPEILFVKHDDPLADSTRFENPQMLKVIATAIMQSEECPELIRVKKIFLTDIIRLCKDCRENRRVVLQMSVWQEWLISLAYIFPETAEEEDVSNLVYELFSILLFHAIRLEYGGWRVWVDTLAITHSKVSWHKYRRVVEEWVDSSTAIVDHVNNTDNHVFVSNTVHILSQLTDSLIMACGGLLPLLAAATAPNSELDIADTTQQRLSISDAAYFLQRFTELADVFIFVSGINFSELEQEKNMPSGGILRQSLRLVSTMAVRNILACRIELKERGFCEVSVSSPAKYDAIVKFVSGAMENKDPAKGIAEIDRLLQNIDLQRLKGIVYRDMEEGRQAQFLALAVVYFLSVLMVSRYRDILEPPTSPSPFFDTNSDSSARKKSVDSNKSKSLSKGTTFDQNENSDKASRHSMESAQSASTEPNGAVDHYAGRHSENGAKIEEKRGTNGENEDTKSEEDQELRHGISSIKFDGTEVNEIEDRQKYGTDHLNSLNSTNLRNLETGERRQYLTSKLQNALESVAPLFREIMTDFRSFLQKTLLGTHGQEIMNDTKVMQSLKTIQGSVVELVMLLCSQEWQTSLQKHAGLAFIELVNEGRLMAHATRDHILRVANEADFIMKRLRAEDVSKHAQFEKESSEQFSNRLTEEQVSDHLLMSSKRRDFLVALKLLEKMRTILLNPSGAWSDKDNDRKIYWKCDLWEDDSRRRKRFVPNTHHKKHVLKTMIEHDEEVEPEELLKELAHRMGDFPGAKLKLGAGVNELVDEADIDKWGSEENDSKDSKQGQPSYRTKAKLIAQGVVVPGTVSITSTDMYFDADEEDELYKQQDPRININILVTEYLTSLQYGKMFYEIYIKTIPLLEDLV
ncbi:concanavalin a-like lectin/glucanases superfamily domain-containing protein [Ditylenchus destructor]|uniref:Concanavalin a-like lectin/glucanases superfamily domain-containing protein n=1 Tax=Ditylenchus destructor TaxID=166010 RepID=A0AAD4NGN8_9BILA|nr:concanavalin a-like lectin/glucanases superfamily domain-containing protein [Ditylenchus destructor]